MFWEDQVQGHSQCIQGAPARPAGTLWKKALPPAALREKRGPLLLLASLFVLQG